MEFTNEFSVKAPLEEAWAVLTDLERIAPCMPGFELQEVDGDEYRGLVKVKVGPITAQYQGVASFRERDEANRRAVVSARGREIRGQGHASASVTATLEPEEGGTHVTVHTDLSVSGKVAQFGRGVLADVSRKLLDQFVQAVEADVLRGPAVAGTGTSRAAGAAAVDAPDSQGPSQTGREIRDARSNRPVDLLATAGPALIRRAAPLVVVLLVGLWVLRQC